MIRPMQKRRGRPSKGPRAVRRVRVPLELDAVLVAEAERRGLTIQDLILSMMQAYLPTRPQDDQLQLTA